MREFDAGSIDELADGAMREAEIDGGRVLLVRDGDTIHAVAATCPHAGAPLAQGIRHGTRLLCPWHKAAFCLRTGAVLEPPAVDPLDCYAVRIAAGRVLLRRAEPAPVAAPPADASCFVIVGGGAAGAVAAQTLRAEGFAGRIVMLDRDNRVPYDRTVLSKYALSGQPGAEKSPLQSQAFYQQQRIERRTATVVHIDAPARRITCADGSRLPYDVALLATGGVPKRPHVPGEAQHPVLPLRGRADADAILAQAERSERAVILGASFIGMEVAASLRERGLRVTVVARDAVPFEKQLGVAIGGALQGLHERNGVRFRLGRAVAALRHRGVVLDDGEALATDLTVMGYGVRPATSQITGLSRNDDFSLTVDAHLRVADGLYAAGDIARFPLHGDGPPVRVEHWRVAEQHGRVAALNMLGRATRYTSVPVFWTIQYRKRVDYIGHAAAWDEVVSHGDLGRPEFLAYFVKNGIVAAAAGMDRDQDTAALIELFERRRDWRPAELGEHPASVLARLAPTRL
jgi:NADPH-dependent 2,4-dienoyl-CoA reductase/sulfur reductase-like enzyme/nitrite reductase/ring-hydroxylating ferredoxin subunit